jgi:hypothetical protein
MKHLNFLVNYNLYNSNVEETSFRVKFLQMFEAKSLLMLFR